MYIRKGIDKALDNYFAKVYEELEEKIYERFEGFEPANKNELDILLEMKEHYFRQHQVEPNVLIVNIDIYRKLKQILDEKPGIYTYDENGFVTHICDMKAYVKNIKYDFMMTNKDLNEHKKGLACKGEF